ncbi:MAG: CreA family protein [Desulfobulbaceae bacterium]|jgi:CreA protein|nr:CreA family protein [Desulfobulbaceae bacterium]
MLKKQVVFMLGALLFWAAAPVTAEEIGRVSTTFKFLGANDKIVIEAFDDPDINGATCYVSRAKTGGVSGAIGVAEDTSDAAISCRQTGPITLPERIVSGKDDGKEVFKKSTSMLFKKVQVVRFYDRKRSTLVYLTYSDKLIEGSPKNSISTIVVPPVTQGGAPAFQGN